MATLTKQHEATRTHPVRWAVTIIALGVLVALGLLLFYSLGSAHAQGSGSALGSDGSAAGSGSAVLTTVAAGSGSAASSPAAPATPDPETNPAGFLEDSYNAVRSGNWIHFAALLLIGLTWLARKPWALGRWAFFKTDRGGVAMAFGLSILGGLGTALAALGKFPTDLATYKAIAMTAVTAMGGYVALKRLLWPADKKPETTPATP
jgi:hypothetical protein